MTGIEKTAVEDASQTLPMDLAAYLGARLGLERDAAVSALGQWLKQYEPAASRPSFRTGRPRGSGVFPRTETSDPRATAKPDAA